MSEVNKSLSLAASPPAAISVLGETTQFQTGMVDFGIFRLTLTKTQLTQVKEFNQQGIEKSTVSIVLFNDSSKNQQNKRFRRFFKIILIF